MLKPFLAFSLVAAASVTACTGSTGGDTGGDGGHKVGTSSAAFTGHVATGTGSDVVDYGGSGAVKSSVKVSALTIGADGSVKSIAESAVSADGSYELDVPIHAGPTLVQALDAKGAVVVSAILEDALVAGKAVKVQPLTTESSVEAAALLDLVKSGTALADVDLVALRARIDAATARLVHDHAVAQMVEATADVHALGVAALTAQMSEQAALKAALVDATAYATAELAAADALTAALDASATDDATTKANADFTAAFAALDGQFGLDATAVASAATNASASAQAAIAASSSSVELMNAFNHAQAMIESVATTAALTAAFTKAAASADVMTQLQTANTTLLAQISAATDAAMLASAFEAWRVTVRGTAAGTGGLLANLLGATETAAASYPTTVTALMALDVSLQTALAASAAASEDKAGAVDPTKLAGLVAQAYATFDAGVQAAVTASAVPFVSGQATLMTSVFVSSEASF
jgi:hypothetical protein